MRIVGLLLFEDFRLLDPGESFESLGIQILSLESLLDPDEFLESLLDPGKSFESFSFVNLKFMIWPRDQFSIAIWGSFCSLGFLGCQFTVVRFVSVMGVMDIWASFFAVCLEAQSHGSYEKEKSFFVNRNVG
jgi:hypothetical protein